MERIKSIQVNYGGKELSFPSETNHLAGKRVAIYGGSYATGEIEVTVKILLTRDRTERPHGALLQVNIGIRQVMYRIGGRQRSEGASLHGAGVGIPLLFCWISNQSP